MANKKVKDESDRCAANSANPEKLDRLITHSFPLDRIEDAWEWQASGQCAKVVLKPWH